jgi:hypothetical protein
VAVLIEATSLMSQARAETEIARINLKVVENQHVVSFNEMKKVAQVAKMQEALETCIREENFALEDFTDSMTALEEVLIQLHKENDINTPDYLPLSHLRVKVAQLFDGMDTKIAEMVAVKSGGGLMKRGDRGYYSFAESSLGQTLFNERGTVAAEFRSRQLDIAPYKEHLSGDRPAWGGEFDFNHIFVYVV